MPTVVIQTDLPGTPEECFDRTRDIGLHCRTAAWTRERAVGGVTEGMIGLGEIVTFEGVHFGVRQRFTARVVEFERPGRFVDEMVEGAFRSMRHTHEFAAIAGGTRMTDTLVWTSPLGALGRLADSWFLVRHMTQFVERRNAALKAEMEGGEPPKRRAGRGRIGAAVVAVAAMCLGLWAALRPQPPPGPPPVPPEWVAWPWPQAVTASPWPGVTRWEDRSSADGSVLELVEFDFAANPRLRLNLYDQDEDDAKPFDDRVEGFMTMDAPLAAAHWNARGRGNVVALWNGPFFNIAPAADGRTVVANHVAPVVLDGRVGENVGRVRWAFGVGRTPPGVLTVVREPDRAALERTFTVGAEGLELLVLGGRSVPPETGGTIPGVDAARTSRTTMAWSPDGRRLDLLVVTASRGGWTVADERAFWRLKGAWGAVNNDGGPETQLAIRGADGGYRFAPAPAPEAPRHFGTLMYWMVTEEKGSTE